MGRKGHEYKKLRSMTSYNNSMAIGGDARVLREGDRDATMEDVGERVRPPGDPPDVSGSWVSKVKGDNAGGMLSPEDVLDDTFVKERLFLEFPNGEGGEPVITIGPEVMEAMNGLWKRCMIVKVLGANVSISVLSRKLRELWKPQGAMHVMDLSRHFFMIRFESEEEYLAALTGGPWKAFGSYLMVKALSLDFDPLKDEIATTPVWVRLSNVPVTLYHRSILMGIAGGLGNPIKVDSNTLSRDRGRFARVCVEVNLKKPLKGTIMVNGDRYFVTYEGLSAICSICGLYGHAVHTCPKRVHEKVTVTPLVSSQPGQTATGDKQRDDGFTPVRQARRNLDNQRPAGTLAAARGNGGPVRAYREVNKGKEAENIQLTNSFGNLEEGLETLELREGIKETGEVIKVIGENKENEYPLNQGNNGKRDSQVKGVVFGMERDKSRSGPKEKHKEKRVSSVKGPDKSGIRPKQNNLGGPTTGLVFGPTRDEHVMSSTGKRLRIERDNVGRSGGRFEIPSLENSGTEGSGQIRDGEVSNMQTEAQDCDANLELVAGQVAVGTVVANRVA